MLDRILSKPTANSTDPKEDCLSCRLIGGGGMACLAVYVLYKTYAARHTMNKWSLMGSAGLGSLILSIASIRLLDINVRQMEEKNKKKKSRNE